MRVFHILRMGLSSPHEFDNTRDHGVSAQLGPTYRGYHHKAWFYESGPLDGLHFQDTPRYCGCYLLAFEHDWFVAWNMFYFFHRLGISSSQLTNSYFSEGWHNHQPDYVGSYLCMSFPSEPPLISHCAVGLRLPLSLRRWASTGRGFLGKAVRFNIPSGKLT